MTLNKPLFLQALTGDPLQTYSAQEIRTLIDALVAGPGVTAAGGLAVSQRAAGANFSVDVAAGAAVVAGTSIADQGKYIAENTATVNLAIAGAPGAGFTRFDLVYAQVRDRQADGGASYDWVIDKVTGTTSNVVPATPANAIPLAQIGPIVSTTTSITTALIKSLRVRAWPLGAARGQVGFSGLVTSSQTGINTETTLSGLTTATSVAAAGRLLRIWVSARIDCSDQFGRFLLKIKEGSTILNIGRDTAPAGATNSPNRMEFSALVSSPSVGTHTYTATLQQLNGTTVDLAASTDEPAYMLIEDLGEA